jgi:hypothetical protein
MTYKPVPDEQRKGSGRTPMPIPQPLIDQLTHSANTGAHCVINLAEIPENERPTPEDIKILKRALVRAGYRHFADKTINKRFTATEIRYWVSDKETGSK